MNLLHQKRLGLNSLDIPKSNKTFSLYGNPCEKKKSIYTIARVKKQRIGEKFNTMVCTSPFLLFFHYNGSKKNSWQEIREKICQQGIECKSLFLPNGALSAAVNMGENSKVSPAQPWSNFSAVSSAKEINCFAPVFFSSQAKHVVPVLFLGLKDFALCKPLSPRISHQRTHVSNKPNSLSKTKFSLAQSKRNTNLKQFAKLPKFLVARLSHGELISSVANRCKGSTLVIACTNVQHACVVAEMCLNGLGCLSPTNPLPMSSNKTPVFLSVGGLYNNNLLSALDVKRCVLLFRHEQGEHQVNNNLVLSLWPSAENLLSLLRVLSQICLLPNNFLQAQLTLLNISINQQKQHN